MFFGGYTLIYSHKCVNIQYKYTYKSKLCYIKEPKNRKIKSICTIKKQFFRAAIRKKINDVNSFNYQFNNIEEMITYFKDKNNKSKKR